MPPFNPLDPETANPLARDNLTEIDPADQAQAQAVRVGVAAAPYVQTISPDEVNVLNGDAEDPGAATAAWNEFNQSGILTGAARLAAKEQFGETDVNFSLPRYMEQNVENAQYVNPFLTDLNNPHSKRLLESLENARNTKHADAIIDDHRERSEELQAGANHPVAQFIGSIGGILPDALALMLVSPTGGIGSLVGGTIRVNAGVGATRALGAARGAGLGASGAYIERLANYKTDPLAHIDDAGWAAIWGAVLGGPLGAAFPRAIGGIKRIADEVDPEEIIEDILARSERHNTQDAAKDAGAAVAPRTAEEAAAANRAAREEIVLEQAPGGKPIHQKLLGKAGFAGRTVLRSVRSRINQAGAEALKEQADHGLTGKGVYWDHMSRILDSTLVNVSELTGRIARPDSWQSIMATDFRARKAARNKAIQGEYDKVTEALYGVLTMGEKLQRGLANIDTVRATTGNPTKYFSKAEFEAIADEIAAINANNQQIKIPKGGGPPRPPIADDVALPDHIAQRLDDNQRRVLLEHARRSSAAEDKFWESFQDDLVAQKMIEPEDVLPHYRPQVWNHDTIAANRAGFRHLILQAFAKEPDMRWVAGVYEEVVEDGVTAAGTPKTKIVSVLEEGESWADFQARRPDLAENVLEDWGDYVKRMAEGRAFAVRERREFERDVMVRQWGENWAEEFAAEIETMQTRLGKYKASLEAGEEGYKGKRSWAVWEPELVGRIGNLERKIADKQGIAKDFELALKNEAAMDEFIRKNARSTDKKKIKRATGLVNKATAREAAANMSKTLDQEINDLTESILSNTSPADVIDKFQTGNSRLRKRQIDLGDLRHTDAAREFLVLDSAGMRNMYVESIGRRIAMRKAIAPLFRRRERSITGNDDLDRKEMKAMTLEGFEQDKARLTSQIAAASGKKKARLEKLRRDVIKAQKSAETDFDALMNEIDNKVNPGITQTRGINEFSILARTATSMSLLGTAGITMISDLVGTVMGGSKLSTGFRHLFRPAATRKILKEIEGHDAKLAAIAEGLHIMEYSTYASRAGVDNTLLNVPGSWMNTANMIAKDAMHLQAKATLMDGITRQIRGAFDIAFMEQMVDDLAKKAWDDLSEPLKTFYARHGWDKELADEFKIALSKHHTDVAGGRIRLPERGGFERDYPHLLSRYERALNGAGDEVLIDPSTGDMPFLNSSPLGKMLLQFTSFMFTAGTRIIPRITQGMHNHPTDVIPYMGALSALGFGFLTLHMKAVINGEEALDRLHSMTPSQQFAAAWARSVIAPGISSNLMDNVFGLAGSQINDALGAQLLPEAYSKFHRDQGINSLAGPVFGAGSTLYKAVGAAVDGDTEKVQRAAMHMIPLLNALPTKALIRAYDETFN